MQRTFRVALLAAATAAASLAHASTDAPAPFVPAPPGLVEWVLPTQPTAKPQSAEEAENGRQRGRTEPQREFLQPSLDPALPAFTPKLDRNTTAAFKGASSDVLTGITKMWFERFKKYYPNVSLTTAPPYAGSLGAIELVKENLDFVFVSRELKPDDLVDFNKKFGYGPLSVPIMGGTYRHYGFLDALGVFVHPDNPLSKISFKQLDQIFSSTHHRGGEAITTWGQLGLTGEWADKPVHPIGIAPWNGFEEFVRQRALSTAGKRGEWRKDAKFEKVVFPMAKDVADDRYAIAYSGLAYIDRPVRMLAVAENDEGPWISPTYENVGKAVYPLSRVVFFNTNKKPGQPLKPVLDEFLRFVLSKEGQQTVLDQQLFLPLRANQVQDSLKQLNP